MRVVVTGQNGQVVRALIERASGSGLEILALGRPFMDLAGPSDKIVHAIEEAHPDVIVSAAAYTNVDRAESEPDLVFSVNEKGPAYLAKAAQILAIPLIHLSTDYVFDGSKNAPYVEEDATGPTGVYGASKLAGEQAVLSGHENSAVLRTAWVYGPFGGNFVRTMLRLAADRDEIGVVSDQLGNPTSALDIADGILRIATNLESGSSAEHRGLFHMTGAGEASWAEFAEAIFAASEENGGPAARVRHIRTADYPTPAKRPANSRLNSAKLEGAHGVRLPDWRSSLKEVVVRLIQESA